MSSITNMGTPAKRYRSLTNVDGVSAIDRQLRPVDVCRSIGGEKHDRIRHFAHGSPPAGDDAPVPTRVVEELLLRHAALSRHVLRPALAPLRRDEPGDHSVDRNPRR